LAIIDNSLVFAPYLYQEVAIAYNGAQGSFLDFSTLQFGVFFRASFFSDGRKKPSEEATVAGQQTVLAQ
jgi:hypothetical protein